MLISNKNHEETITIGIMVVIHIISYFQDFRHYKTIISNITIDEVNLANIDNGEYTGEYDAGYIYAKVKVIVKSHSIEDIYLLEHHHERGAKAEPIVKTMISKQKIDVDSVSGATNSSLVIKKACVNALTR